MKNSITFIFLLTLNMVQGQFQERFNLNYGVPVLRNERFNSGIKTTYNFMNGIPANFYYAGIGTSYNNTTLPAPNNIADRMRFTLLGSGAAVVSNRGYQFSVNGGSWLNSSGNSIAEISSTAGTGGYVAVGAVSNNAITQATVAGGSDVLFTRLNSAGLIVNASKIDINLGRDIAWTVRRSQFVTPAGGPTWIICGQSTSVNNVTSDCFVARVDVNGVIIWCKRYNFLINGSPSFCIAKQLCEDANNNIYIVGTIRATNVALNDGLVYKISPVGALAWAKACRTSMDMKLEAVRLVNGGASIVVGGYVSNGGTSNMLILQVMTNGVLGFRNILRAQDALGNVYPSQCFDIIQIPGGPFYLAGFLIRGGALVQMIYRVAPGGAGLNWYRYNTMLYREGFGLSYVDGAAPGIALFSSIRNPVIQPLTSDAHIMKTDLFGKTCPNFCDAQPPSTLPINIDPLDRYCVPINAGTSTPLYNLPGNYDRNLICIGSCQGAAGAASVNDAELKASPEAKGTIKFSPNPVSGLLHMQFNALPTGDYEVTLLSMKGDVVIKRNSVFNNGSSVTDIDMSTVASGVYLLRVRKDNLVIQEKIVKQR